MNSTVKQSVSSSITGDYFNENHFGVGTACALAKIAETAYNMQQSDSATVQICHDDTWQCFKYGVQNGIMEFKDINTWMSAGSRGTYEDNAKFYNQRYSVGTNYTVRYLLQRYSENAATLDAAVLLPGAYGRTYSLKLNNLKGNYQAVGFGWNSSWSVYSTDDIK